MQGMWVWALVGKLRPHIPAWYDQNIKKKKKKRGIVTDVTLCLF